MPIYPRPEGWTSPYDPGHADDKVSRVIDLLHEWFLALQDGSYVHRLPDPSYERRGGKHAWTEGELELLIATIDSTVNRELSWASKNSRMQCDAGPGYSRLPVAQRLALAQQIDQVLREHEGSQTV